MWGKESTEMWTIFFVTSMVLRLISFLNSRRIGGHKTFADWHLHMIHYGRFCSCASYEPSSRGKEAEIINDKAIIKVRKGVAV